jgi:hypothetical protein
MLKRKVPCAQVTEYREHSRDCQADVGGAIESKPGVQMAFDRHFTATSLAVNYRIDSRQPL